MSNSIDRLIVALNSLPGVSKKQAERIAYSFLIKKREEAEELSEAIQYAIESIQTCEECGHLTDEEICHICKDQNRQRTLVIVESSLDILKFEKTDSVKSYYHVLGGLIDVSNNKDIEDLNLLNLQERSKKFSEVIIALSPNLEGIVTANYIKALLKDKKVTQLAQGIPLGAAMEYVDELTLKAALDNRKEVK